MMGAGDNNGSGFLTAIGGLTFGLGNCLLILYGIFYALVTPGFTVWFARTEQISDGLKLTEVWEWTRRNLGTVVLIMIAYIIASIVISTVASIVGTILCIVGLIVTIPLGTLATYLYQYHLIGQLAYKDRTGTPYYVPPAPVAPAAPAAICPPPAAPARRAARRPGPARYPGEWRSRAASSRSGKQITDQVVVSEPAPKSWSRLFCCFTGRTSLRPQPVPVQHP